MLDDVIFIAEGGAHRNKKVLVKNDLMMCFWTAPYSHANFSTFSLLS